MMLTGWLEVCRQTELKGSFLDQTDHVTLGPKPKCYFSQDDLSNQHSLKVQYSLIFIILIVFIFIIYINFHLFLLADQTQVKINISQRLFWRLFKLQVKPETWQQVMKQVSSLMFWPPPLPPPLLHPPHQRTDLSPSLRADGVMNADPQTGR